MDLIKKPRYRGMNVKHVPVLPCDGVERYRNFIFWITFLAAAAGDNFPLRIFFSRVAIAVFALAIMFCFIRESRMV